MEFEVVSVTDAFSCKVGAEIVRLTPTEIEMIERSLEAWSQTAWPSRPNYASTRWGIPSSLVRVDMPPIQDGEVKLYEVEGGPGGLGFAAITGATTVFPGIVRCLKQSGVTQIRWGSTPSRLQWHWEIAKGIQYLEAAGLEVAEGDLGNGLPFLLRSSGEDQDIPWEFGLCDYGGGGGDKTHLNLRTLAEVEDPFGEFPNGFTLKPRFGTGAKEVHIFAPFQPFKKEGATLTSIRHKLQEARKNPTNWVIQPFFPPEIVDKNLFRIWRLFAVWDGLRYRVVGGIWNARKSLRIHGASDTVMGAILT